MPEKSRDSDRKALTPFDRRFLTGEQKFTVIGSGSLGGKAQGLADLSDVLERRIAGRFRPDIVVNIPTLTVIATDCFDRFMERNNLYEVALSDMRDDQIAHAFQKAELPMFYGSYPITPASEILQELARLKNYDIVTFQAEDEIAAMCSVIGASFAGSLAVTGTSGPGLDLKQEAIGLAVTTELPMVIVNVQRGGPSTGLPTKTEQADLLLAVNGRHGECPLPVIAALSPADCFAMAMEAARLAIKYMTPVILLTDGYIANGAEPWRIPRLEELPELKARFVPPRSNGDRFQPYTRDENLARPWALPGTRGLAHRIGGLEKQDITGDVCYDPDNHQRMTELREQKVQGIAGDIPLQEVVGPKKGRLLVLGWGGTHGAIQSAGEVARDKGQQVACATLRYLNPFPRNLEQIIRSYDRVLIPELNTGQLRSLIRAKYLVDAEGLNKVQGRPFMIGEISSKMDQMLNEVSS